MSTAEARRVTEDEYLTLERVSEIKHEYVNGEMVAMAGARPRHNLVVANLIVALGLRLRGGPCLPLTSDQRVHVRATGLYTYPDVPVVCGQPDFHPEDPLVLLNPSVVFEVLSKSTEEYDRGAKFAHYRRLHSLREYVLVATAERRMEHFRRLESGQWLMTEVVEGAVELPVLGVELPVDEVYLNLERFPPDQ